MPAEDVFSADQPVNIEVGFNDLVGDGQKYKDPDALAKAYANLEAHARKLEAENAEARARIDSREASNTNNQPAGQAQSGGTDQSQVTPPIEAPQPGNNVDLRSQIREEVQALTQAERAAQNMEQTAAKLVEVYGSPLEANNALRKRAGELGVSVDWLRDSAAQSPSAFYATMGLDAPQRSGNTPVSAPGVRVGGSEPTKNFEYFDRMRKDNPKLYFSAATQSEMMRQARVMGSDFYKR